MKQGAEAGKLVLRSACKAVQARGVIETDSAGELRKDDGVFIPRQA
jgi:hypothetical protein